ncbi:MAG: phosphotransferase [Actinomycetota bacterium]|nr:phosphotransferase [Actinomycetota bacterium]
MEGKVIDLGDNLVAKIWHRRTAGELEALQTFYEAVACADAAFDAPRIHQVLCLDGQFASVEARLSGRPLWTATDAGSPAIGDDDVACVTDVLAALAAIEATADMGVLPILEDEVPFETRAMPFARSLAALVERRVEKFRGPLLARFSQVDDLAAAVVGRLVGLEPGKPCLVHGDLIPANILVDNASRPLAVLDFGFMTTIGDPAFDAAITASIYDMYGPRAAENEAILDGAINDRLGYEPRRLALYRAAYALITSNCFSASSSDGHFEWCMRMLERPQVHEALEL